MSYKYADSLRAVSKPVWHIPLLCVQWKMFLSLPSTLSSFPIQLSKLLLVCARHSIASVDPGNISEHRFGAVIFFRLTFRSRQTVFAGSLAVLSVVGSSWYVMEHGDAREGKWRGMWRMEWVASTLHTTSEHGVSSITTADAHTSASSSRLNWRTRRLKWTRPFRR